MPSPTERWLPRLFKLGLLLLLGLGAWQCRDGWPVSANLMELVPQAGPTPPANWPKRASRSR